MTGEPDIDELLELLRTHVTVGESRPVKGSWIAMGDLRAMLAALERIPKLERELERLHSWTGLIELLNEHYPAEVFGGTTETPDMGVSLVRLVRAVDTERVRAERLEAAAAAMLKFGEHEGGCSNHDDASGTESCVFHVEAFNSRRDALVAALAPTPAECPRCGSPKPELHPAVQADGGEVSPCSDPFHASSADGRRILANLPAAPTPAEEGRNG